VLIAQKVFSTARERNLKLIELKREKLTYTFAICCFVFNIGFYAGVMPHLLSRTSPHIISALLLAGIFSLLLLIHYYPKLAVFRRLVLLHIGLSSFFLTFFYGLGFLLNKAVGYAIGVIYVGKLFESVGRLEPYFFSPVELKIADRLKTIFLISGVLFSLIIGEKEKAILTTGLIFELTGFSLLFWTLRMIEKEDKKKKRGKAPSL